jgi:hypothetical protein
MHTYMRGYTSSTPSGLVTSIESDSGHGNAMAAGVQVIEAARDNARQSTGGISRSSYPAKTRKHEVLDYMSSGNDSYDPKKARCNRSPYR